MHFINNSLDIIVEMFLDLKKKNRYIYIYIYFVLPFFPYNTRKNKRGWGPSHFYFYLFKLYYYT